MGELNGPKVSEAKEAEIKARLEQENADKPCETPAGDVYGQIEGKDSETGVQVPTDAAVEEAKEWVDEVNQR